MRSVIQAKLLPVRYETTLRSGAAYADLSAKERQALRPAFRELSRLATSWLMRSLAIALLLFVSTVASADERKPGRCVVISEPGQTSRLVCDVPPSEGCATATVIRPDGAIVTRTLCVESSR